MSAIASFVIWTIKVSVQMPLLRWHRAHWTKPTRSCASKSGRQQRSCWFTQECWFQSHRPRDWSAIIWQPVGIMFCNWLVSSCWLFLSVNGWNHKKGAAPQTTLHLLWLTVKMPICLQTPTTLKVKSVSFPFDFTFLQVSLIAQKHTVPRACGTTGLWATLT